MKKYIAPAATFCYFNTETNLLTGSDPTFYNEVSDKDQDSNRRTTIWGDED